MFTFHAALREFKNLSISKSLSLSGSKQEGTPMALRHERLDVYRLAIGYVAWVYEIAATLEGVHRAARDQ